MGCRCDINCTEVRSIFISSTPEINITFFQGVAGGGGVVGGGGGGGGAVQMRNQFQRSSIYIKEILIQIVC